VSRAVALQLELAPVRLAANVARVRLRVPGQRFALATVLLSFVRTEAFGPQVGREEAAPAGVPLLVLTAETALDLDCHSQQGDTNSGRSCMYINIYL